MSETLSTVALAVAMLLVAAVMAVEVQRALRAGVTGLNGWGVARRAERPLYSWFCTVFQGSLMRGLFVVWYSVRGPAVAMNSVDVGDPRQLRAGFVGQTEKRSACTKASFDCS